MKQVHGTKELDIAYLLQQTSGCGVTIFFKGLQNRGQSFEVLIHAILLRPC